MNIPNKTLKFFSKIPICLICVFIGFCAISNNAHTSVVVEPVDKVVITDETVIDVPVPDGQTPGDPFWVGGKQYFVDDKGVVQDYPGGTEGGGSIEMNEAKSEGCSGGG